MKKYLVMLAIMAMVVMGGCSAPATDNNTNQAPKQGESGAAPSQTASSPEEINQFEQEMIDKAVAEVEKVFDKKIDKSRMDFSVAEEIEQDKFERIKDIQRVEDVTVVGHLKGEPKVGEVIDLTMEYDREKDEIELLQIKPLNSSNQQVVSYEESKMKDLAEKFIEEKNLVPDLQAIVFEKIEDKANHIELEYDEKEDKKAEGITIGLDKITLEPIMFER